MSLQLTKKQIKENYYCIGVAYCDLQYLLSYFNKLGYYAGVYGWRGDVYLIPGTNWAICTGYETIQNIKVDDKEKRKIIKFYNNKAMQYGEKYKYDYKKIRKQAEKDLIALFNKIYYICEF